MTEYQFTVLLVFIIYTFALWLFFRFLYRDSSHKENNRNQSNNIVPVSVKREHIERLEKENAELKAGSEKFIAKIDCLTDVCETLDKRNKRLTAGVKMMKGYIDVLFDILRAVQESNKNTVRAPDSRQPEWKERVVYDSGTTFDEFEAMVQLMKGRPVTRDVQQQAIRTMQKNQGTEIYNQLIADIITSKEQVQAALNGGEKPDNNNGDSLEVFDMNKYIRV
jgi:hypothetical protein